MEKKEKTPKAEKAPKKLTRKERKLLEERRGKEQQAIESALVKQGRLKTRVRYERRSFWWNVLAISLAFLFGILAGLGGLVGGIYFVGKKFSVKSVLGADYTKYVNEAYAEMSFIDLIQDVVKEVQNSENISLNTFGKYSPIVKTQVQNIADVVGDAGIHIDVDGLMATPFSDLGTYFQEEVVQKIELGGVLGVKADSDGMMISLCYGKEGVDYDITEGAIVPRESSENYPLTVGTLTDRATDVIYSMELGTMLGLDPSSADAIMMSICYGTQGVDYTVDPDTNKVVHVEGGKEATTIQTLIDDASGLIGGIEVESVLSINADSSATMRYLAYGTEAEKDENGNYVTDEQGNVSTGHYYIKSEGENKTIVMRTNPETNAPYEKRTVDSLKDDDLIEGASIGDLIEIDENSSGLMQSIQNWTIGDMKDQSKIESLCVGDVMNISDDATGLMAAIKEWTIGNLKQQHRIERLKISDVITVGDNPSKLFQAIGSWRIKDLTEQGKIDSLMLNNVLDVDENSPEILKALAETPLGEFNDAVKTLPLSSILGEGLEENKLLRSLQNSTVETLSDDIKELSIDDVFAEDIYSYATNYVSNVRPAAADKVDHDGVESYYSVEGEEVLKGYFKQSGTAYVSVAAENVKYDAEIARDNRAEGATFHSPYYTEERVPLKPVYTWYVVNYDTGELEPMTDAQKALEMHPVSEDEAYIVLISEGENGEKTETRYDLERVTSYTHTDDSALTEEESAKRVYSETVSGTTNYYILERVEVFERYYAEAHPETVFETADTLFRVKGTDTEVTRYLSGMWYALLGEDANLASETKILDIANSMSGAITRINEMELGEMYAHEILNDDPDVDISNIPYRGTTKTNLNQLNIMEVIELVKAIAQNANGGN